MWPSISHSFAIIVTLAAITWLLIRADRNAQHRRAVRLQQRRAVTLEDWSCLHPKIPERALNQIRELIEQALNAPRDRLLPSDSFARDLALTDRFLCLVIDDDSTEAICDAVEDRFGTRPKGECLVLEDAVREIWAILENSPAEITTR